MDEPSQLPVRRYDEKEVALLLERAAQLQRATPTVRDPSGLTLRELEEIAAEAGLDPGMLRQAAAELEAGRDPGFSGRVGRLAGAPLKLVFERVVPGEVSEAAFPELLHLVHSAADLPGQASQVGRTFSWTSSDPSNLRQLHVLVAASGGNTRIRIEERYLGLAGAVFGGGLGGAGFGVGGAVGGVIGAALVGSVVAGLGIAATVIGLSAFGARRVYRLVVSRRRTVLERLLVALEQRVASATPAALPDSRRSVQLPRT
jgi:hypothetical protein